MKIAFSVCLVLLVLISFQHVRLHLSVAMAEDQIDTFELMRQKATGASDGERKEYLNYLQSYYPSGSKQTAGSKMDRIVEYARSVTVSDIQASGTNNK
jgi:hypothetical protein